MSRQTKLSFALCSLVMLSAAATAIRMLGQQQTVTISGRITGASGNHPVYIALWDASGFLNHPSQQIKFAPHATAEFRFQVAPGNWAISAYEDENENGKLDMGIFGPKEPSGFWRAFHGWHKPRFAEVSSTVAKDVINADIQLHK
jgi:uncharacterized protein (DUF2141 family)